MYFFLPGTTTPQNVYSDSALSTPLSQPVVADSGGNWVQIYCANALYRVQLKTSADVLITDWDNVDLGQGVSTGTLPVSSGGTGATTAGGARSNLGLGTASTVDTGTTTGRVPVLDVATWTPGMSFGGTSAGVTYSTQSGTYIKTGSLVVAWGSIVLTNNGSGTGTALITSLPFTCNATFPGMCLIHSGANFSGLTSNITGNVTGGGTTATLNMWGSGGVTALTDTNVTNTATLSFTLIYTV